MSELYKIVLTSCLTIVGGIIVITVGQIIRRFFIQPLHEWLTLKGEITDSLIFYARVYANPGILKKEDMDEAQNVLRRHASQLMAKTYAIPWYRLWELLKVVHCYQNIREARRNLIGLSNSVYDPKFGEANRKRVKEIEKLLNITTGIIE